MSSHRKRSGPGIPHQMSSHRKKEVLVPQMVLGVQPKDLVGKGLWLPEHSVLLQVQGEGAELQGEGAELAGKESSSMG